MRSTIFRVTKYAIVLGVAIFCLGLSPVHADTVFDVTGTFSNGATLSGTVTINTASFSQGITSLDLTISTIGSSFSYVQDQFGFFVVYFADTTTTSGNTLPELDLIFPVGTLFGYSGGDLCSTNDGCAFGSVTSYTNTSNQTYNLKDGYVSYGGFTTATPEPGTLVLLASGLAGLVLLSRKRPAAALIAA